MVMAVRRQFITVIPGTEFTRVANALREVDASMPTRLRKDMRDAVKPAVAEAKARVRSLPTPSQAGSTGLRRRVARGVRIQAKVARAPVLRVTTSMADPSEAIIPRGLDRTAGWRHPVYGNMNNWVRQPGYSWFRETIADARPQIEDALTDVLEDARDTIARAGI